MGVGGHAAAALAAAARVVVAPIRRRLRGGSEALPAPSTSPPEAVRKSRFLSSILRLSNARAAGFSSL